MGQGGATNEYVQSIEERHPVCEVPWPNNPLDGHAICTAWDFCHYRIDGSTPICWRDPEHREYLEMQYRLYGKGFTLDDVEQMPNRT